MKKGDTVLSRDGAIKGTVRGAGRLCRLEGCGGWCVPVRWSDGKLTWPCSKGLRQTKEGWQIA